MTLGFLDFRLQYLRNPALARHLGLEGEPRGALVIRGSGGAEGNELVRRGDVILAVDGFDIDSRGEYLDPDYGYLSMANLSTRGHVAGDELDVGPVAERCDDAGGLPPAFGQSPTRAVPRSSGGDRPEYLLAGGVLLQNLDRAYLSALGRRAPVRLTQLLGERVEAGSGW